LTIAFSFFTMCAKSVNSIQFISIVFYTVDHEAVREDNKTITSKVIF